MTTGQLEKADSMVAAFEALDAASPLHEVRRAAFEHFSETGWPTTRDEAWRYTNVRPIADTAFTVPGPDGGDVAADRLAEHRFGADCHELVFVNGRYAPGLSSTADPGAGIRVRDLRSALAEEPGALDPCLARYARYDDNAFAALNTAFIEDGAVVMLPAGATLEHPVHLVFVTATGPDPVITHPRVLVVAEAGSRATVIERYVGLGDGVGLTNAVTEIVAGEKAEVDHYRVQRETARSFHVSTLTAHLAGDNDVRSLCFNDGAGLARHDINAILNGAECDATFNGLGLACGDQLVDNNLRIDHLKPNCRSWQYYKSILDDRSTGVFAGRIYVAEDAQKTDAKQTNMSLLLSDDAHAYTQPQLEIFADDVKCTHGATVGQLEETELFYLRARGIPADAAHSMLVYAFAKETLGEVRPEPLRRHLEHVLLERLPAGHVLRGGL
jgi:Fe-S cluster assembly protein SufD